MSRDSKPVLLFYCQCSVGLGHLVRSLAIADALSARFRVRFLSGGPLPDSVPRPRGIEVVELPSLNVSEHSRLGSRDPARSVVQVMRVRRQRVLDCLVQDLPQVVVIELFPFGRKKFAFELLPLLRAARSNPVRPLIVCSVRDLLVNARRDQQRHDDRARWLTDRYFDAVLVHSDPQFASFEASFSPSRPLGTPIHYTGFVSSKPNIKPGQRRRLVLVSAGGGRVGRPLLRAAVQAFVRLWPRERLPMRLIAGPYLPSAEWRMLQHLVNQRPGIQLVHSVADLSAELARASVSISQCGYNTALEVLRSATPALVVPYAEGRENEQTHRAQRLQQLGLVQMLSAEQLDGERLAVAIRSLLRFQPRPLRLDINGAENSAHLIADLYARSRSEAPPIRPLGCSRLSVRGVTA